MFVRNTILDVMNQSAFRDWMTTSEVGDNARYFTGDSEGGHLMKRITSRHAMEGRLFLFQLRNIQNPKLFDYYARRMSPTAGKVLKMGEYQ